MIPVVPSLPQVIGAVEEGLDQQLLSYFTSDLSKVLNIYYEQRNPFTELILPLAIRNTGLMHSMLCLAGSCLLAHQAIPNRALMLRRSHHFGLAIVDLRTNIEHSGQESIDSTILQTILHCLEAISTGNGTSEYRFHLQATQRLVENSNETTPEIRDFARLFLSYQNFSNFITSLHPLQDAACMTAIVTLLSEDNTAWSCKSVAYIHALEGLLSPFARVRYIRDQIRHYRDTGRHWCANDALLHLAFDIDSSLRTWECPHSPETSRYHASLLYRQCAWIYLYRTVKPSGPNLELSQGVNEGLSYLSNILQGDACEHTWIRGTLLPFVFILGCAAFEPEQREMIRSCFETLQMQYFGNVGLARRVVEQMWYMMDQEFLVEETWCWEGVMAGMGLDVLI